MEKYDVVGIGYPSLDHIVKVNGNPTIGKTSLIVNNNSHTSYYGGCAINIIYLLSQMKLSCGVVMNVGNDFESSGFMDFLKNGNVSLDFVKKNNELQTSYTNLIMTPTGEHITLFYPGPMDEKYFEPYSFKDLNAQFGILTIGEINGNKQFMKHCIENNIPLVFSMKGDYSSLDYDYLLEVFENCELIFMNETEFNQLNSYLPRKVLDYMKLDKANKIIITDGENGSTIHSAKGAVKIPAYTNITVQDTAGGGDAYIAGFLMEYVKKSDDYECGISGAALSSFIIEKDGCLTNIPSISRLTKRKKMLKESLNVK
jgi:adenosine kinase